MTTSITSPKANVPVGRVTINGQVFEVQQHPEFVRFFFDLFRRVGQTSALTNVDLAELINEIDSVSLDTVRSDPSAVQALRETDELRNEVSSLRNDCDSLRSQLAEIEAQFAGIRASSDLRNRVEQLEDRIT